MPPTASPPAAPIDVDRLVARLADLVAHDTQNPGGDEPALARALASQLDRLGARDVTVLDTPPHAAVYARVGQGAGPPALLLNAHLDTVPANRGYTRAPLRLAREGERLYGLGSADTKGAIACALEALAALREARAPLADVALLFSGDEERGGSAVKAFLDGPRARGLARAVVCEPTGCRLGVRHRGIGAARAVARSPGGHSSRADLLPSPVVILSRVAVALDELAREERDRGDADGFPGLCLNVAGIDGFVAFNVIPAQAELRMSVRPPPGRDVRAVLAECAGRARAAAAPQPIDWHDELAKPPFATRAVDDFRDLLGRDPAHAPGAPVDLDFWTEAALYAARGIDAVVFGPGEIAQAHAPDEFVPVSDLVRACASFQGLLRAAP